MRYLLTIILLFISSFVIGQTMDTPNKAILDKATTGLNNIKAAGLIPEDSHIITIIDFSKPNYEKRLWVIDINNNKILINTWVAHGQGSGGIIATKFSDRNDSHQSSLGFYITDFKTYRGKHGVSLKIHGLDKGFNTSAYNRKVVVHSSRYVSQSMINRRGHIGYSWGCAAVSNEISDKLIRTIKGGTIIFMTAEDSTYKSKYLSPFSSPTDILDVRKILMHY